MSADNVTVLIEFIQTWGHPTKNLIMGVGDRAKVSRWAADNLISGGYAVEVKEASA